MSKLTKIMVYINVAIFTFFINMGDVSSGSHIVFDLNNVSLPRLNGVPNTLFVDTNPRKKSQFRGLASDKSDLSEKDKKVKKTDEKKEEEETYSLLDPNLYEGGSDGASNILQINQINNRINQ